MADALGTRAEADCAGSGLQPTAVDGVAKWQIHGCPVKGVSEFRALVDTIRNGQHAIDYWDFEHRLKLGVLWEWNDLQFRVSEGLLTAERLDQAIHTGLTNDTPRRRHGIVPGPP
jgi:hypothetical protein